MSVYLLCMSDTTEGPPSAISQRRTHLAWGILRDFKAPKYQSTVPISPISLRSESQMNYDDIVLDSQELLSNEAALLSLTYLRTYRAFVFLRYLQWSLHSGFSSIFHKS